jgi:hypothetical protein
MADRIQKNIGVRAWKINMFDDFDYMGLATPIEGTHRGHISIIDYSER